MYIHYLGHPPSPTYVLVAVEMGLHAFMAKLEKTSIKKGEDCHIFLPVDHVKQGLVLNPEPFQCVCLGWGWHPEAQR
jgi:hypothetical protein